MTNSDLHEPLKNRKECGSDFLYKELRLTFLLLRLGRRGVTWPKTGLEIFMYLNKGVLEEVP